VRINYRTPAVTSIGGRAGRVRSADGVLDLELAVPKDLDGPGGKTNPEELFAAAYAACFHSAVKRIAAEKRLVIGHSAVEAHVSLGANDDEPGFTLVVELHVSLPGTDVKNAKDVVCLAHMLCPYSNATRDNIDVTLSVTPADGTQYDVTQSDWHYARDHA
jgi:osmotically inducible protein OsmC